MRGDLELGEDVDVGGRLVRRHDGTGHDAAPQHIHGALPRQDAPPETSKNVSFESFTPVMTQICSRDSPRLCTCLPRCREGRGIVNDLRVVALERLGKIGLVELAAAARSTLNEG